MHSRCKTKGLANVGIDRRTFRYRKFTLVQWSFDADLLILTERKLPQSEYDKSLKARAGNLFPGELDNSS